jgi:hypothetical protein
MLGRRSRAIVMIAAGLSAGALASAGFAAATSDGTSTARDQVNDESTVESQDVVVADESPTTAGTERFWGPECGTGEPTNHGQFVAASDRNGESRSAAAHSPCGKPLSSLSESGDDEAGDEGEAPEVEEPEAPEPDESGVPVSHGGGSQGESHGHGHG